MTNYVELFPTNYAEFFICRFVRTNNQDFIFWEFSDWNN